MSPLELSTEQWPLAITTLGNGVKDADYVAYFARFEAMVLARGHRFASLVDGSSATEAPTPAQRKMIAEWQQRQLALGSALNVGVAMVLPSRVVRGALTALHWLFPPPTPTVALATFDEGYEWCIGRLEASDVPVAHLARSLNAAR
jgi:hypothetical protein